MKYKTCRYGNIERTCEFSQKEIIEALVLYAYKKSQSDSDTANAIYDSYYKTNEKFEAIDTEFMLGDNTVTATISVSEPFSTKYEKGQEFKSAANSPKKTKVPQVKGKKKTKHAKKIRKTIKERVYKAVAIGHRRFRDVMGYTKLSKTQVANALYTLKLDGVVINPQKGFWEPAPPE